MALADLNNRDTLREAIQLFLGSLYIPYDGVGLSSDNKDYFPMYTNGMNTERLSSRNETCCKDFTGWVARQIGAPGNVLGGLDYSQADFMQYGSWHWANCPDTWDNNLHPLPGDFFSMQIGGQRFGHVGIVYDYYEGENPSWIVVHGGQGTPRLDYIRWAGPKVVNWAELTGWVDIVTLIYGPY